MRTLILTMVVALFAAACGGDPATDETRDETPAASPTTSVVEDDDAQNDEATPSTTDVTDDDTSSADEMMTSSGAVLSLGGETYRFLLFENGSCDPDFFGGFRAFLTRVDDSDQPIEDPTGAGSQGITFSVSPEADGVIGANLDGLAWTAGTDDFDTSSIDSVAIDGNRAEATATFVEVDSGEVVNGSVEVTCIGG